MKSYKEFDAIYLHRDAVDFRKGVLSLAMYIEAVMELNPSENALFISCSKNKQAIKMIYWDKTGFAMWHKILDKDRYPWPRKLDEEKIILSKDKL